MNHIAPGPSAVIHWKTSFQLAELIRYQVYTNTQGMKPSKVSDVGNCSQTQNAPWDCNIYLYIWSHKFKPFKNSKSTNRPMDPDPMVVRISLSLTVKRTLDKQIPMGSEPLSPSIWPSFWRVAHWLINAYFSVETPNRLLTHPQQCPPPKRVTSWIHR